MVRVPLPYRFSHRGNGTSNGTIDNPTQTHDRVTSPGLRNLETPAANRALTLKVNVIRVCSYACTGTVMHLTGPVGYEFGSEGQGQDK